MNFFDWMAVIIIIGLIAAAIMFRMRNDSK